LIREQRKSPLTTTCRATRLLDYCLGQQQKEKEEVLEEEKVTIATSVAIFGRSLASWL